MNPAEGRIDWQQAAASFGHDDSETSCPYPCPFCLAITALKQLDPDVKSHLSAAGTELLLAIRSFVESLSQAPAAGDATVQRIPFD